MRIRTGMYALRERRQHVTQEDFEFAVAKVSAQSILACAEVFTRVTGFEEEPRRKHVRQQAILIVSCLYCNFGRIMHT